MSRLVATRHISELGLQFANGINISRVDPDGRIAEEWAIWSTWMTVGRSDVDSGDSQQASQLARALHEGGKTAAQRASDTAHAREEQALEAYGDCPEKRRRGSLGSGRR